MIFVFRKRTVCIANQMSKIFVEFIHPDPEVAWFSNNVKEYGWNSTGFYCKKDDLDVDEGIHLFCQDLSESVVDDIMRVEGEGPSFFKTPVKYCTQVLNVLECFTLNDFRCHFSRVRIQYLDVDKALGCFPSCSGPKWFLQVKEQGEGVGITCGEFRTRFFLHDTTDQLITIGSFKRSSLSVSKRLFRDRMLATSNLKNAICPKFEVANDIVRIYCEIKKRRMYLVGKPSGFKDADSIQFYFSECNVGAAHRFRIITQ